MESIFCYRMRKKKVERENMCQHFIEKKKQKKKQKQKVKIIPHFPMGLKYHVKQTILGCGLYIYISQSQLYLPIILK